MREGGTRFHRAHALAKALHATDGNHFPINRFKYAEGTQTWNMTYLSGYISANNSILYILSFCYSDSFF